MVHWHSVTQAEFSRTQSHEAIAHRLKATPNGARLLASFESLDDQAKAA